MRGSSGGGRRNGPSRPRGFTLTELLIVIFIVLLVSVLVIPAIFSSFEESQVASAARTLQAAISGARDAAIRANEPRGIRLLPDDLLMSPTQAEAQAAGTEPGSSVLAFSRIQPIEPAPDYQEGKVSLGPYYQAGGMPAGFPIPFPNRLGGNYPIFDSQQASPTQVLILEESPFVGGYTVGGTAIPNSPTSWYWNIRIGDKIRINNAGPWYTVVGPCNIHPFSGSGLNTDLFVNVGQPGTQSPLVRTYYDFANASGSPVTNYQPEFLLLVNGRDDDKDGYTDEGWDGFNQNLPLEIANNVVPRVIDDLAEWTETETWLGAMSNVPLQDPGSGSEPPDASPSLLGWLAPNITKVIQDKPYTIKRRPIASPGSREQRIPGPIVIDATTWNAERPERSRLPVDLYSHTVDILINPDGQIVPQTIYSSPTAYNLPFYHFWLTERKDVFPPIVTADVPYLLPMPAETPGYPDAQDTTGRVLKGNRRLLTIFTKSGHITTSSIEPALPLTGGAFTSGFLGTDVFNVYRDAQVGITEATKSE